MSATVEVVQQLVVGERELGMDDRRLRGVDLDHPGGLIREPSRAVRVDLNEKSRLLEERKRKRQVVIRTREGHRSGWQARKDRVGP